jgi:sugar-specific transcriptional regulator TrmB
MNKYNYEQQLTQIGLNKEQALVYESLLGIGLSPVRILAQNSGLKRSFAYKILDQLIAMGLAEKKEVDGKVTLYFPTHPSKLKEVIKKRSEEIQSAETSLNNIINKMISDFNLLSGKPNVQFFEGLEGIRKVLEDSLTSVETIDAYSDIESIEKYIPEINKDYVEKRRKFNIKKRGLILDTQKARELLQGYNPDITENRFIKCSLTPSTTQTIMQIYDNKVSYITLGENFYIGMIIESPNIYQLQKYLFQTMWESLSVSEKTEIKKS